MSTDTKCVFLETELLGQTGSIVDYPPAFPVTGAAITTSDSDDSDDSERWRNRRNPETFKPFPLDCLPPAFRRYVTEKARSLNMDPAGLAMALLTQAGAHIGAAVRLRIRTGWEVAPILWTALIGISGCGKSPTLNTGIGLVKEREKQLYKDYKEKMNEYVIAQNNYERQTKKNQGDKEETLEPPVKPTRKKTYITSGTIEGVHDNCKNNPKGLFIYHDELTVLFNDMDRNQGSNAAAWLSGYNGGTVNTARKESSEIFIENAYWSIVGGTTPEKFYRILEKENRKSDGTLGRFLLIWAPETEAPCLDDITFETESDVKEMFGKVIDIPYESEADKVIVRFDEQSANAWKQWENEVFYRKKELNTDVETTLWSKSMEALARIEVILHVLKAAENLVYAAPAEWTSGENYEQETSLEIPPVLSYETFKEAETIIRWAIQETMECYRRFGYIKPPKDESREVLGCIRNFGPLTVRDIGQKMRRFRGTEGQSKLIPLLENLESAREISKEESIAKNGAKQGTYKVL